MIKNKIRKKLAAALSYKDGDIAPKMIAKGEGIYADKIIEAASVHDIPIVSDQSLAASLAALPVSKEIPELLYRAAAEVIAYCYLKSKGL